MTDQRRQINTDLRSLQAEGMTFPKAFLQLMGDAVGAPDEVDVFAKEAMASIANSLGESPEAWRGANEVAIRVAAVVTSAASDTQPSMGVLGLTVALLSMLLPIGDTYLRMTGETG